MVFRRCVRALERRGRRPWYCCWCVCDVDRSCEGKRWDLLGFKTLNVEAPLKSIFEGLPLCYRLHHCRRLSSPRQIQGKNDFGGTRTRKDPGGVGGRLANTRRRLGVQRGEAKKRERERDRERDCFILKRNLG